MTAGVASAYVLCLPDLRPGISYGGRSGTEPELGSGRDRRRTRKPETGTEPELGSGRDKNRNRDGNRESGSDRTQDGRGEVVGDNLPLKVEPGRERASGFRRDVRTEYERVTLSRFELRTPGSQVATLIYMVYSIVRRTGTTGKTGVRSEKRDGEYGEVQ